MTRYLITLEVESGFYQEAYEEGKSLHNLLEELELDLQDQIEEYDLQQLIKQLVSSENQNDVMSFVPKKKSAEVLSPAVFLMSHQS